MNEKVYKKGKYVYVESELRGIKKYDKKGRLISVKTVMGDIKKYNKEGRLIYEETTLGQIKKYNNRGNLSYEKNGRYEYCYKDEVTARRQFKLGLGLFVISLLSLIAYAFINYSSYVVMISVVSFISSFFIMDVSEIIEISHNIEDDYDCLPFWFFIKFI